MGNPVKSYDISEIGFTSSSKTKNSAPTQLGPIRNL